MRTIPKHARIVIVGGGIVGCSTAYHLARLGFKDILLLEQGRLTSGTTWHAAGLIGQLRPNRNMTMMSRYGIDLYARLEQETGFATGWRACGSLYVAQSNTRFRMMRQQASLARRHGVVCEEISPREAQDRFPLMRIEDLVGALWLPEDGKANPTDLCMAMARGAQQQGVSIVEATRVIAVHTEKLAHRPSVRGVRVRTCDGDQDIACEILVNCTGQWARQFAALAGVNVPLYAAEHFYIVTGKIEGVHPMLPVMRDPDGYIYYKEELGGLLMGGFEPVAKPWRVDPIPDDFQFQLLSEDWVQFEVLMKHALQRTPCLETAGVKMLLNGPESFTPDGNFIMGEAPELDGYFVCAGFNSSGIANSGGAGRLMAEWIAGGEASMDLSDVDIRRYAYFACNRRALAARTSETLGLHYAMRWPKYELQTARPLRTSAIYDLLAAKGAVFGSKNGWERTNYFQKDQSIVGRPCLDKPHWLPLVQREQAVTRGSVAVYDQSSLSKILVQGRDALALLQRLCTNDVDLPLNGMCYTLMLNQRGGIESALTVIRIQCEVFMIVSGSAQAVRDTHWIVKHQKASEQVVLTELSPMFSVLALIGPAARQLLSRLCPQDLTEAKFGLSTTQEIDVGFARLRAARISTAGGLGFELFVPVEMTRHVYLALHEAGGDLGLCDAGHYALDGLRIERGRSAMGSELGSDSTPFEAGLERFVRLNKPDFIGREALLKEVDQPARKRLVRIVFQDPEVYAWGAETIVKPQRLAMNIAPHGTSKVAATATSMSVCGDVSSAGWGIEHGSCVGLGYVYDEWAVSHHQGTQAEVMLWGEPSPVLLYSL